MGRQREMKITRGTVWAAAGLVLLGFAIYAFAFHAARARALERYRAQLLANGEKLTIDDLLHEIKWVEENSVSVFQKTLPFLNEKSSLDSNPPSGMRMIAPGKAMVGSSTPNLRGSATNTWEELADELASEQEAFELWHQIRSHPSLDFHLDYHAGFSLLLPHLSRLKQAAQRLSAAASYELHLGETEAAITNIGTMLAIVKGMHDEPLVISQLVRIAIANIAIAATWELLQSPGTTDAQLAEVQREWAELEFSRAAENALVMERAMMQELVRKMRSSTAEFAKVAGGWSGGSVRSSGGEWWDQAGSWAVLKGKETMWRFKWSGEDELRALQGEQTIIESIRQAREESFKPALQRQATRLAQLGLKSKSDDEGPLFDTAKMDMRSLISQSALSLQRIPYRLMTTEAARQIVLAAIALKRFELRHKKYPNDLAELVPEFLAAVPRDPVDGTPLKYRLRPDGTFLLYSVGEDGEDNGGDATSFLSSKTFPWQKGKDWVWPAAATAEEVANYFRKLDSEPQPQASGVLAPKSTQKTNSGR
jgi:hypothetical protein